MQFTLNHLMTICSTSGVCRRALASLLNILQGHLPEELSREPASVVDPMFEILLELAATNEPSTSEHVRHSFHRNLGGSNPVLG